LWIDHAANAENDVVTNVTSCADDGVGSDLRTSLDHDMWLDRNVFAQLHAFIDNGARMNSRRELDWRRSKPHRDLLESLSRAFHSDYGGPDFLGKVVRHKDGCGAGFSKLRAVTRIVKKGNLVSCGFGQ